MIFTKQETLDESIIKLLSKGKTTASDLFELMETNGDKSTIQAKYKALRALIKGAVVVKSAKNISLNQEWVEKIINTFHSQISLPVLADGESVTFKYNSLSNLDAYWKHLMKSFDVQLSDYPVFLYSPYHIWYHIADRNQSESDYFNGFQTNKHYGFFVIGNSSKIDTNFKNKFQSDHLQIDTWKTSSLKDNDYLTIIDDYVIHTILDDTVTKAIRDYYEVAIVNEETSEKLNQILESSLKSKIKIERNAKKARVLRKKLFKNFYLPKEVKEKYNLF